MDRFGNKYFENLEEELPRLCQNTLLAEHGLTKLQFGQDGSISKRQSLIRKNLSSLTSPTWSWQRTIAKIGTNRAQLEPGWHAWISYLVDKAPNADLILKTGVRPWELKEHRPNLTATRAAFKTYSTWVSSFIWDYFRAKRMAIFKLDCQRFELTISYSVLPKITAWNPENITPRQ